jgi:hypothetical protein
MSNGSEPPLTAQGMAEKINLALEELYIERYGQSLPEAGKEDREMLFLAISRGILAYLEQKEKDLINTMTLQWKEKVGDIYYPYERPYEVKNLDLNIEP